MNKEELEDNTEKEEEGRFIDVKQENNKYSSKEEYMANTEKSNIDSKQTKGTFNENGENIERRYISFPEENTREKEDAILISTDTTKQYIKEEEMKNNEKDNEISKTFKQEDQNMQDGKVPEMRVDQETKTAKQDNRKISDRKMSGKEIEKSKGRSITKEMVEGKVTMTDEEKRKLFRERMKEKESGRLRAREKYREVMSGKTGRNTNKKDEVLAKKTMNSERTEGLTHIEKTKGRMENKMEGKEQKARRYLKEKLKVNEGVNTNDTKQTKQCIEESNIKNNKEKHYMGNWMDDGKWRMDDNSSDERARKCLKAQLEGKGGSYEDQISNQSKERSKDRKKHNRLLSEEKIKDKRKSIENEKETKNKENMKKKGDKKVKSSNTRMKYRIPEGPLDISRLDLRAGQITFTQRHPFSSKLFVNHVLMKGEYEKPSVR